jgi:leucyl aminopeptidase (aminopeptidase T)
MTDRVSRLAELSVHGANVQEGQIVLVGAEIGHEEQARATAEAAYKRGAKFVDVAYFDPYVKRGVSRTPTRTHSASFPNGMGPACSSAASTTARASTCGAPPRPT